VVSIEFIAVLPDNLTGNLLWTRGLIIVRVALLRFIPLSLQLN